MKRYTTFSDLDRNQTTQQQLDGLRIFQYLLRNNTKLKEVYHDKNFEIADGLQPWIDALEITLKKGTSSL